MKKQIKSILNKSVNDIIDFFNIVDDVIASGDLENKNKLIDSLIGFRIGVTNISNLYNFKLPNETDSGFEDNVNSLFKKFVKNGMVETVNILKTNTYVCNGIQKTLKSINVNKEQLKDFINNACYLYAYMLQIIEENYINDIRIIAHSKIESMINVPNPIIWKAIIK